MKMRSIGGIAVSAIGLGCVGMSAEYGSPDEWDESVSLATLERAFELGISFYDTADSYGPFTNERLLSKFVKDKRDNVVISTKAGLVQDRESGQFVVNGKPEPLKAACKDSLQRLNVDVFDLYILHRVDPTVPIEERWGTLLELQHEGHVKSLGICAVDVPQLKTIQQMGSVTAVQSEFSLWTRDALQDVIPWCVANGAGFVPFAPLGRGFLTGTITSSNFDADDIRLTNPRFAQEAITANQAIVDGIKAVADRYNATPAQIAIAWILEQDELIVPIPGTKRIKYLEENVATVSVELTNEDLSFLDQLPEAVGSRY